MESAPVDREDRRGALWAATSLLPVALFQWIVFFSDLDHFFQGDAVYWLYNRHRSWSSFFHAFVAVDNSGWYRPLANRILESILYPFYGLNPVPYHVALFPILLLDVLAVYQLSWTLTRRRFAAFLTTFLFGTHLVNAYVSYDSSFTPELLYTLFYVLSAIAYLKYLRTGKRLALALSVLCCVATLCSKEAGVTLPFMLVVIHVFETGTLFDSRAWRSLRWCFGVLLVYAVFVVGYLRVGGIGSSSFFNRDKEWAAGYQIVFDRGVLVSAGKALSEAFMLRSAEVVNLPFWLPSVMEVFRFGALVLLLLAVLSRARKIALLGLIWFLITLAPMLTLGAHFMMYYLFLPMAGLSLAIGVAFDFGFDHVARWTRFARPVALAVVGLLFGAVAATSAAASVNERIWTALLGGSSRAAQDGVAHIRARHPRLTAGTRLLFLDKTAPELSWNDGDGALFRMAFNEEKVTVLHAADGEFLDLTDLENDQSIVVRYDGGVFRKVSKQDSVAEAFPPDDKSGRAVSISPTRVVAGKGAYTLRVEGVGPMEVTVYYRLNAGRMESFMARLKDDGSMSFDVGANTRRGTYEFLAIMPPHGRSWIRAEKTVVID